MIVEVFVVPAPQLFLALLLVTYQQTWVGKKVMPKAEAVILVGDEELTSERFVSPPYTVVEAKSGWLRLAHTESARVRVKHIVTLEQAPKYFEQRLKQDPNESWAYSSLAIVHIEKGEFAKAISDFDQVIRIEPQGAFGYNGRGGAWYRLGKKDEAMKDFSMAIRLDPKHVWAYESRGMCLYEDKQYEGALRDFDEAVKLDPANAPVMLRRGDVYYSLQRFGDAVSEYDAAGKMNPRDHEAIGRLARVRAMCVDQAFRDGKQAVELATKACELTEWKDYYCLGLLGAAHAEQGDFAEALKWEAEAKKIMPAGLVEENAHAWREAAYKLKKAIRDPGNGLLVSAD